MSENPIHDKLEEIAGFFVSLQRDIETSGYYIEIGVMPTWEYGENEKIGCEVVSETSVGKVLKIYAKKEGISVDDLISFGKIIININLEIEEKENEFKENINKMKSELEGQVKAFYENLDNEKKKTFKTFGKEEKKETPVRKKQTSGVKKTKPEHPEKEDSNDKKEQPA
jgi:uncharacterized protein YcgL (UPF0745 family)